MMEEREMFEELLAGLRGRTDAIKDNAERRKVAEREGVKRARRETSSLRGRVRFGNEGYRARD
jgi:hypothetical protein